MTALRHRVGRDGLDEELLHEIADHPRRGGAADRTGQMSCASGRSAGRSRARLLDHPQIGPDHGRVDPVPVHRLGVGQPGLAVAAAQGGIARIGFERIGERLDVAGLDQQCRSRRRGPGWSRRSRPRRRPAARRPSPPA